jgi:two-component system sensor histidine kinase/response regulator
LQQSKQDKLYYDIVLLDWHMPEMDGIELATRIRQLSELPALRLVMLSSAAFDEEAAKARKAGIVRYLNKPVKQEALFKCLTSVINLEQDHVTDQEPEQPAVEAEVKCNAHILLVEDNLVNQEVARHMLQLQGCRVSVASNGQEAVEMSMKQDFQLIFMDCRMPVMDGFKASVMIRELEKQDQKRKRIPIIALTANIQKGIQQECNAAGMDDYMSKPFEQKQLQAVLYKWLGHHQHNKNQQRVKPGATLEDNAEPVLQQKPLDNIRSMQQPGSPSILNRIITIFLQESPNLLASIQQAVSEKDSTSLLEAAHSLKSSSANLGAVKLSAISRELEALGKADNIVLAGELLDKLESAYNRTISALTDEMADEEVIRA